MKFRRRIPFLLRLKMLMPRSLFARTLLIIVVPTLITLAAATYVFFDRHWYTVTNRLTYAVAGDVAVVVDLLEKSETPESVAAVKQLAQDKMDLFVSFAPGEKLSGVKRSSHNPIRAMLRHALNDRVS